MTPLISCHRIDALCQATVASGIAIEVVEQTGSTNADLLARVANLPASSRPIFRLALRQTAGRGRAGRAWRSEPGDLTFSLAWPMHQPLHTLSALSLAVGVAIAEVLANHDIDVKLKWPNDVLLNGNKLAGVLIQGVNRSGLLQDNVWVVIGIGINMLVQHGDNHAAGAALAPMDRESLLAALLTGLAQTLNMFQQHGFVPFSARWNALHAHADQAVDILEDGRPVQRGHARGVDVTGRLLLQTDDAQLAIVAGDVSLRPVATQPARLDHTTASHSGTNRKSKGFYAAPR